jgi:hypothetical protein
MGIPPEVMRKWTVMVERAEMTASQAGEPLVPASRVRELKKDIEDLNRELRHEAMTIQILEKKDSL